MLRPYSKIEHVIFLSVIRINSTYYHSNFAISQKLINRTYGRAV